MVGWWGVGCWSVGWWGLWKQGVRVLLGGGGGGVMTSGKIF